MELHSLGQLYLRQGVKQGNLVLQPGQSFLIEVLNRDSSGKAQIRLGGQVISALLEVPAQVGEKFVATVQRVDQNGILLVRDKNVLSPNFLTGIDLENLHKNFISQKENSLGSLLNKVLSQLKSDGKLLIVTDGKGAPIVTDGKGTSVVTDGKGTPVVTDGKGAPIVTDGKGTPVVADGKGASVVTDGKGAPVVVDGKGTPVVADGKGAPLVADGKGTPVVVDGKGAPVVGDSKGTSVVADGKGTPVVADGKGAPIVTDGKGAPIVTDGKGTPVIADGKGTPVIADGKGTPVIADGKGTPVVADGKGASVVTDGKGAPVMADGKGAPIVTDGKSAPVITDSKGTPVVIDGKGPQGLDGNVRISNPNLDGEERLFTGQERLAAFIEQNIPQWSNLSKDGFMQLFFLLRSLGLDYERRLRNIPNLEGEEVPQLQRELGKTLKGILLSLLGENEGKTGEKGIFQSLLERLTGQQILLQGGTGDTNFFVLELPVMEDGEIFNHTLAIKGAKKGKKIDLDHCRLALHTQTKALGELGLEGWLYEGNLNLKALTENPQLLESLVRDSFDELQQIFQEMNINLRPIQVSPWEEGEDFRGFLQGEFREGVDIRI